MQSTFSFYFYKDLLDLGAPRLEAHPNYNVGSQPTARARAGVGTHTHPFCLYNLKSQTGCGSSATVFTTLLMSAFASAFASVF